MCWQHFSGGRLSLLLALLCNTVFSLGQETVFNVSGPSLDDPNATYLDPPYPGRVPTHRWVALGDSFSAGPGAGCRVPGSPDKCERNQGAYAAQMQRSTTFKKDYKDPQLLFQSCTGDTILPVVKQLDFSFVNDQTGIVTLSVGGNDIGFSSILKSCVLFDGGCDEKLAGGRNLLYGEDLFNDYIHLTSVIMGYTHWHSRTLTSEPIKKTLLYVTGYPAFFDTWTDQCDKAKFNIGTAGAKMTKERRKAMNLLGQELNLAIAYWLDLVNLVFASSDAASNVDYAKYVDQDWRYNGHRFCREGVTEPSRNNKDTWFFHFLSSGECKRTQESSLQVSSLQGNGFLNGTDPKTCMSDEMLDSDDMLSFTQCSLAIASQNDTFSQESIDAPSTSVNDSSVLPEWVTKTFHPRTAGFEVTKDEIIAKLSYLVPLPGTGNSLSTRFRIMAIDDDLTIGANNNHESYRRHLWTTLNAGLPNPPNNPWVYFVGDKQQGSETQFWSRTEAIANDATIENIHSAWKVDKQAWDPNVVLIMTGSVDVRRAAANNITALQSAVNQLELLVNDVKDWCDGCVILIAQVPPQGPVPSYGNWTAAWPPSPEQMKVIQFNALLAELVNKLQTQSNLHVIKVHTGATLFHQNTDGTLRDVGYKRIAMDFAEALHDAAVRGWIPLRLYSDNATDPNDPSALANLTGAKTLPSITTSSTMATIPSSSSSPSPTSTSTTTLSTSSSSSASPTPTSKLAIAYQQTYDTDLALAAGQWNIYAEPISASSFDVCKPATTASIDPKIDATIKAADPTAIGSVPFPSGDISVGTLGNEHTDSDCTYDGDGMGPGTLDCSGGAVKGFECKEAADLPDDAVPASTLTNNECGTADAQDTFAFKVLCTW